MDLRGILSSIYHFSKLSIQSLGLIAKAKYKHRKAKATFRETLILYGIPPEAARELAEAYPNPIDEIFNIVKTAKI
jgi:hypothetical protein